MGGGTIDNVYPDNSLYLILGATGNLGRPITAKLLRQGSNVFAIAQNPHKIADLMKSVDETNYPGKLYVASLTLPHQITTLCDMLNHYRPLTGMIYALGNCPPGGFTREVADPILSALGVDKIYHDFLHHVMPLARCFSHLIPYLQDQGHLVIISSAITDLAPDRIPPRLHAGHYAMACAAKEQFAIYSRIDPRILTKNIRVHYIAPGAVDTPFHHGAPAELTPPAMLTTAEVTTEVVRALHSPVHVHQLWRAQPK